MPTVYRKTAKGVAEIETRAHRLPPRLRQALILVDGKRDDQALRQLIAQQPDDTLYALAADGFIEMVAVTPPAAPPPAAAPTPAAAPRPAAEGAVAANAAALPFDDAFKRDATRTLLDLVGPMGEALALKIERARSAQELLPLLALAHQSVRNVRGAAAAARFGERFLPPPEPAAAPAGAPPSAPAGGGVPAPAAGEAAAAPALAAADERLKREALHSLGGMVGAGSEPLLRRIEHATTADELRALLEQAHRHVETTRGAFAAAAFADRFLSGATP
jgi:hypothetical protein